MRRLALATATVAATVLTVGGIAGATVSPTPVAVAEAPARVATAGDVAAARVALPGLRVAADVAAPGYDREARFGRWPYVARGCDLRDSVLASELTEVAFRPGSSCDVAAGELDGRPVTSGDVDIDHVVPLRLSWVSGAAGWSDEKRRAFASDRRNLRVELSGSNRSDGAAPPETSAPAPIGATTARCRYGVDYVLVAQAYGLSVTPARADALGELLGECP